MFGKKEEETRFVTVSNHWSGSGNAQHFRVLKDIETGVLYCIAETNTGTTMTVLVDKDGKPLLHHK